MPDSIANIPGSGAFSAQQTQYLQGFFAGAMQRVPFAGHNAAGAITNSAEGGVANLAAAEAEEPSFWGTPLSELCAEEVWKFERNPLDAWDALLEHAAEDKVPDAEFRYRFKSFGLFYVAPAQDSFMLRMKVPGGRLSSERLRGLAAMADQWGPARLDLTTRANMQIRELPPTQHRRRDEYHPVARHDVPRRGCG